MIKIYKKVITVLMATAMICSLTGCNANKDVVGESETTLTVTKQIEQSIVNNQEHVTSSEIITQENDITTFSKISNGTSTEQPEKIEIGGRTYLAETENLNIIFPTQTDINKLSSFTNLKSLFLDLYSENCAYLDLSTLSDLKLVETLLINGNIKNLSFIEGMTSLKAITLEHFNGSFESMPKSKSITEFTIGSSCLGNMNGIENLSLLESISMCHININDRTAIGKLASLKKLYMTIDETLVIDLKFMEYLKNLEYFEYYPVYETKNIDAISMCSNLKEVNIMADINNIDFVLSLSNLESFTFYSNNENEININKLKNCSNLKEVKLTCNYPVIELEELKDKLPKCKFE